MVIYDCGDLIFVCSLLFEVEIDNGEIWHGVFLPITKVPLLRGMIDIKVINCQAMSNLIVRTHR